MSIIISLFNHKGGVGKTTNAFHLAWKFSEMNKKVLMVDADPQCNLTGLTLGVNDYDTLLRFYSSGRNNNLYTSLKPFFEGTMTEVNAQEEITATKNPNLYILPGHVDTATFDDEISTAIKIARKNNMYRLYPLVGMYYNLIKKTAALNEIDIVVIDMSPSISATNICLLMGSDYFILPTAPDFFSHQAIDSLSRIIPMWPDQISTFRDDIILPRKNPKMLGTILQNYRRYSRDGEKSMAKAFGKWASRIRKLTKDKLVVELLKKDMIIPEAKFREFVHHDEPYNLGEIQNFNTLIAKSQEYSLPIYCLTEENLNLKGNPLSNSLENIEEANRRYSEMAESILNLVNN